MKGGEVFFVNSTDPLVPQSDDVRLLIRKRAMKHVAQTRKSGKSSKHRTFKSYSASDDTKDQKTCTSTAVIEHGKSLQSVQGIWELDVEEISLMMTNAPSSTGFASLRAMYGIDVSELSMLTTFHVGRATPGISKDLLSMSSILRAQTPSYLAELPKFFGQNDFLDLAIESLLARMNAVISPKDKNLENHALLIYYRALKHLQLALEDSEQQLKIEVLSAVCLLSMFEVLDKDSTNAWKQHADGAARLIQLRGAYPPETEFEKSLLFSQIGPIVTEAILDNRHCFLEADIWNEVFQSLAIEGHFGERHPLVVQLRRLFAMLPGIFADVTKIVCSDSIPNPGYLRLLKARAYRLQMNILEWHKDLVNLTQPMTLTPNQEDLLNECNGTYLALLLLLCRLIGSISFRQLPVLEEQALSIASQLIALERALVSGNPHLLLFVRQKRKVAASINSTSAHWLSANSRLVDDYESLGIISTPAFQQWCQTLNRKTN